MVFGRAQGAKARQQLYHQGMPLNPSHEVLLLLLLVSVKYFVCVQACCARCQNEKQIFLIMFFLFMNAIQGPTQEETSGGDNDHKKKSKKQKQKRQRDDSGNQGREKKKGKKGKKNSGMCCCHTVNMAPACATCCCAAEKNVGRLPYDVMHACMPLCVQHAAWSPDI